MANEKDKATDQVDLSVLFAPGIAPGVVVENQFELTPEDIANFSMAEPAQSAGLRVSRDAFSEEAVRTHLEAGSQRRRAEFASMRGTVPQRPIEDTQPLGGPGKQPK